MTLIELARDGDVVAVDSVCNRLEAAERLIDRLALSLRVEADIYTNNDPEDGPPEHISEALFMAKQFREGVV